MRSKLVALIALLSIMMVVGLAVKWLYDHRRVYQLTIATAGNGGEYFAFGEALAQVISRHHPQIQLKVLETRGSHENMELLDSHEIQLAIVQNETPARPTVRAVASLFPEVFHLIATERSNVRSVANLIGKRIALMPERSGSYEFFWRIIKYYGLTKDDFYFETLSPQTAHEAFRKGEVDAVFRIIGLGNRMVGELIQNSRGKLVPLDQVLAMKITSPFLEVTHIPKGTYNGAPAMPEKDIPTASVRAVLLTHQDVEKSIIREITRIMHEHHDELVAEHPQAARIKSISSGENLSIPLHPGAKAYYNKDKPGFLLKYSELMGFVLSITILVASGFWQLRLRIQRRKKNRADMYNIEILNLVEQVSTAEDLEKLETYRKQLFNIFKTVIKDLDQDRISPESFQSFTFPWEVAISTIRHREITLMNLSGQLNDPGE